MTVKEINKKRNANGVFSAGNDVAGWFAISKDGINMITFHKGKFTFSTKDDVNKFYTIEGFAKKVTNLLNGIY